MNVPFCKQEFMSLEHKKLWYGITTEEAPAGADLVPCLPLSTILRMFGVTHIDFFSLDVVGRYRNCLPDVCSAVYPACENTLGAHEMCANEDEVLIARQLLYGNNVKCGPECCAVSQGAHISEVPTSTSTCTGMARSTKTLSRMTLGEICECKHKPVCAKGSQQGG